MSKVKSSKEIAKRLKQFHIEKEHDRVLRAVKGKNWAQAVKRDY